MYLASSIVDSWKGLNAWRQNYDPNGKQLEDSLTVGESGMYYQDEHPMLTLQNLESIMPDYSEVNYPAWSSTVTYLKDQIVKEGGINYKAIQSGLNKPPATEEEYWKVFNPFSEWLDQKTEAGIIDLVLAFLEKKEMNKTAKTIIEDKTLFDGIVDLGDVADNVGDRTGLEVVMSRSRGMMARLTKIGLICDTDGDVTIYLHHSSTENSLKSKTITINKANTIQWEELGWDLPNVSSDIDSGGAYFVSYKQSELPGKLIVKRKEKHIAPSEKLQAKSEINVWKLNSPFIEFHPFRLTEDEGGDLWDVNAMGYDYSTNNGLNLAISLYCDYTQFFIEQRDLFKSALRKQVAINLLRELAYNSNSRISQDSKTISKEQILYEIDGDTRGRGDTSMQYKYNQSLEAIQLNVEGLHRVCLPCKSRGVRYGTI